MIMSFEQKKNTTYIALEPQGYNNGDMFCGLKINCIFSPRKKQRKRSWGLIVTGGQLP